MIDTIGLSDIHGGINLIDLGSSGQLSSYWSPLAGFINLYAFDPNEEECRRLSVTPNAFASATYIPEAVAGHKGAFTLYKTRSVYCWSLLEPDSRWLSRFSYHDLFTVESTSTIEATTLEDVEQLRGVDVDAIKSDTQGLELPILEAALSKVDSVFLIETETGLVENYKQETTFHQISRFMQEKHFLLFDINMNHRISRANQFVKETRNHQILWCEAIWLKDYIRIDMERGLGIDRPKALKALLMCANHGCIDYGFELATLFFKKGLIIQDEYDSLKHRDGWMLSKRDQPGRGMRGIIRSAVECVPKRYSAALGSIMLESSKRPYPFGRMFRHRRR